MVLPVATVVRWYILRKAWIAFARKRYIIESVGKAGWRLYTLWGLAGQNFTIGL